MSQSNEFGSTLLIATVATVAVIVTECSKEPAGVQTNTIQAVSVAMTPKETCDAGADSNEAPAQAEKFDYEYVDRMKSLMQIGKTK